MQLQHSYAALPPTFWSAVEPTPVAAPRLLAWNAALAGALGLDPALEARAAAMFSGNAPPPQARPIAMAYAGHQFGHFVPQLGDGRAILLGEVTDPQGRRFDVQLKGAGPTPFSRNGDGRAAIGPVLREFLVSEAMHALGVPTTRALAAVATGEAVFRDGALPGAVLTRIAASHVRVGTFQFFAAREEHAAVRALVGFVLARHYPALADHDNPPLALLEAVVQAQARLVAAWMQVGFVHGVMNTDNMAVSGETIDYGPCAFLDEYHPAKTFSSIDRRGRYAFGNQPGIAQWNLARLAECLLPLIDADGEQAVAMARAAIEAFAPAYREHWLAGQRRKLGLSTEEDGDEALAQDFLEALQAVEADYTLAYRALSGVARGEQAALPKSPGMDAWLARWRERLGREPGDVAARVAVMDAANPAVIPRNHLVEAALAAAAAGDLAPFEALLAAVRRPFDDGPAQAPFMAPPAPEQRVTHTFCGT
ncbi:protein adenylyltransferase SelO [Arenimonas sp.]|uniref:protein adenylyltransferase SelO n=1 Tax=Arenimonas sp. TaxID=1872635 RepID=UPI002E2F8811|nr:YdiU family protein [Arenimonas sp.]HEX4852850.1 YdiU family protein [Arenimonas sp.]